MGSPRYRGVVHRPPVSPRFLFAAITLRDALIQYHRGRWWVRASTIPQCEQQQAKHRDRVVLHHSCDGLASGNREARERHWAECSATHTYTQQINGTLCTAARAPIELECVPRVPIIETMPEIEPAMSRPKKSAWTTFEVFWTIPLCIPGAQSQI